MTMNVIMITEHAQMRLMAGIQEYAGVVENGRMIYRMMMAGVVTVIEYYSNIFKYRNK